MWGCERIQGCSQGLEFGVRRGQAEKLRTKGTLLAH